MLTIRVSYFRIFLINNYPGTNETKKLTDATSTSESITSLANSDAQKGLQNF